jgi:inhibitor of cysteine peptidase
LSRITALLVAVCLSAGASALLAQTAPTPPTTATAPATAATAKAAELAVSQADNGKTLNLGTNKTVAISLPGNATTGYSWAVTKIDGTALEQTGSVQYVPDRARAGMVGSGGTSIATFRAVKPGQSTITLGYARPWETGTPPANSFTVTLVVDQAP